MTNKTNKNFENHKIVIESKQNGKYVDFTNLKNQINIDNQNELIDSINNYIENANVNHPKIAYDKNLANDIYLIPVGQNQLHVRLAVVEDENKQLLKRTVIDGYIVNNNSTFDAQLMIDLLK